MELRAGVLPSDDASTPLDGRVLLNAPGPDINGLKAALADIQVNWVIDGTGDFPEGTVWNYGPGETTFSLLGDVVFGIKLDPNNLNFITAYTLVNSEAGILVTLPSIADVVPVPTLKRLLISNPNDVGNMPVEIKIGNETVFLNKGPDGAVIDGADGTDVAICLSPRQVITDAFVNKTKPVTLEGTFAVEVDGEVIPVSYLAEDLPKVFKPNSTHSISFQKQSGEGTQLILQNEMRTRDKEVRIIRVSKEGLLSPQVDDYFQDLSNGASAEIGIFLSPTTTFNCDGALTETNQFDLNGKWGVEINGVVSNASYISDGPINALSLSNIFRQKMNLNIPGFSHNNDGWLVLEILDSGYSEYNPDLEDVRIDIKTLGTIATIPDVNDVLSPAVWLNVDETEMKICMIPPAA